MAPCLTDRETPKPVAKNCASATDRTKKRYSRNRSEARNDLGPKRAKEKMVHGVLCELRKEKRKISMRHYTGNRDKPPESAKGPAMGNPACELAAAEQKSRLRKWSRDASYSKLRPIPNRIPFLAVE